MNLSTADLKVVIAAMEYALNDLFGGPEGEEVSEVLEKVREIERKRGKTRRLEL